MKEVSTLWAINNDNQITEKKRWILCLLLIKKGRYQLVKWKLLDPNICKNLTTLKPRNCSGKKTVRKDSWDRNEDSHSQYSDLLDHTTFHNTSKKLLNYQENKHLPPNHDLKNSCFTVFVLHIQHCFTTIMPLPPSSEEIH